jgi:hypothetical protein
MGAFEDVEDEEGFCRWNWSRLICESSVATAWINWLLLEFQERGSWASRRSVFYGKLDGVGDFRLKTLPVIVMESKRNRSVRELL